jgi:hypothetical protein
MNIERKFLPLGRYHFDMGACSIGAGFAQVDTRQDAPYFGQWINPFTREIVSYCEGDVTRQICETDAEFVQAVRELEAWTNEHGYGPLGIDPGVSGRSQGLINQFQALGLGELLH